VIDLGRHATGDERPHKRVGAESFCVVAATPGGVYQIAMKQAGKTAGIFDYRYCDLLVLDEASQINLPEAIMGALALKDDGQLIVIGDHRQMPPIVQNDWEREVRRTFVTFRSYESLFLTLRNILPEEHQIRFQESFRVHADIAEFLRKQIYKQDGIDYFSQKTALLPPIATDDPFVAAVLDPSHPLTVVVHEEMESQQRNRFEQQLMQPVLETLAQNGFDPQTGLGVVVPHTAQRAALRSEIPELTQTDPETGAVIRYAVDTVERFQGAERVAIVVGATESDPLYLLANSRFLLDPRRINVAISRAKSKLVLVGSRAIFDLFPTDEDVFASAQLWKNLLADTCTQLLWTGSFEGIPVQVWGNVSSLSS
jgi:superfamily I DNA and/or RNA helicase